MAAAFAERLAAARAVADRCADPDRPNPTHQDIKAALGVLARQGRESERVNVGLIAENTTLRRRVAELEGGR